MNGEISGNGLDVTVQELVAAQKVFNRYTLTKTLGSGGMGIVWLAHDEDLERDVALKFLPYLLVRDRAVMSDLKRETKRSLELTHKNIVRIYDFVHDSGSGAISMEYVDGDTLSNLRADKRHKIFETGELKEWISQLCDALDYAHNHARIVHRDLKPANLMVNQRADLKIADFGIARSLSDSVSKVTMQQGKSGTLVYMSPQQLDGDRGTPLDDIYSLGATIYELLTSRPPFYSGNIDRQIREKIPPPMAQRRVQLEIEGKPIEESWEDTIRCCLAKDPTKRPQSVAEIAHRLEMSSPKTRREKSAPVKRPSSRGSLFGAAIILATIGIGVWYFGLHRYSNQPTNVVVSQTPASQPQASAAGTAGEVTATPAVIATGGLVVDTSPPGATVTLGGQAAGKSPVTFQNVPPGAYPLRIVLEGYEPVEKRVEIKGSEFTNPGTIALQRAKAVMELSSVPAGAKVFQDGVLIGTTPLRRDNLASGEGKYVLYLDGYLPHEFKASLDPGQVSKQEIALSPVAPLYAGTIHLRSGSGYNVPLAIALGSDLKSGTMTQSARRGDTVVKFAGVWEGTMLRAVTNEVVSKPNGVAWEPEVFTLQFSGDGKSIAYECNADGKTYIADLTGQTLGSTTAARLSSIYKGTITGGPPLTIVFGADRKSGTMTESAKSGDVVVKFTGVWDGSILRAVTNEVISKPAKVKWEPESFTLQFSEDGKSGSYECSADGKSYTAQLSPP